MNILKKILKIITHRVFIVSFLIVLQILLILSFFFDLNEYYIYYYIISEIIGILMAFYVIGTNTNPGYKIAWIMLLLIFPILGILIYIIFGGNALSKRQKKKLEKLKIDTKINYDLLEKLKLENKDAYLSANYLIKNAGANIYNNVEAHYLKIGEEYFSFLKEELKKAKKFIFMEYFIITPGIMWEEILEILKEKVKEGVEVRLIYDDLGTIFTLPSKYKQALNNYGIKVAVFNKFVPFLKNKFNNRDHRKITVIDGLVAFTGGINLADEYINKKVRFGHWKDSGIMFKGDAVWSFTYGFLAMWNYINKSEEDFTRYKIQHNNIYTANYIIPYFDNPWDNETVGENVYLNMINKAKRYIYITTPYLVIDNEMVTSLMLAAKNGVDVRIITPGIPDKKIINKVTKSYYEELIKAGVKIYEYTPGFIHEKIFIVDDEYVTIGTINLDYRSLYLHFECGVWLYDSNIVKNVKEDYLETMKKSNLAVIKKHRQVYLHRLWMQILKLLSPLM